MSVDYWSYQNYIQRSKGEFTVAKDQYVRLKTGWFSDRSACYLAAGRPVITQETGFTKIYGQDGGLFGFKSLGEIVEAAREIRLGLSQALPGGGGSWVAKSLKRLKWWIRCSNAPGV